MNILINYLYEYYPFTTASYLEDAINATKGCKAFRSDNFNPDEIDFVLNVEPVPHIIKIPGKPCLYYEIDNHVIIGNDRHFYKDVDLLLLAQPKFIGFYSEFKTAILPLAADPKCHKRYSDEIQEYDIGFIGNDTYPHRHRLLEILDKNFKLLWTTTEPREPYGRAYNKCKMIFNCSMDNDINMRFFEGIACGRLLISDYLPEQDEFASDGIHYASYKNTEELIERVKFYLKNDDQREKIAKLGMDHIHKEHNYKNRINQIICLVKNLSSSSQ